MISSEDPSQAEPLAAAPAIWAPHTRQSAHDKVEKSEGTSHYGPDKNPNCNCERRTLYLQWHISRPLIGKWCVCLSRCGRRLFLARKERKKIWDARTTFLPPQPTPQSGKVTDHHRLCFSFRLSPGGCSQFSVCLCKVPALIILSGGGVPLISVKWFNPWSVRQKSNNIYILWLGRGAPFM